MIDSKRVYLDTAPIIYFLENSEKYGDAVMGFFEVHDDYNYVTSVVSLAEYLTGAMKVGDGKAVESFDEFVKAYEIEVLDIDSAISIAAARIRSRFTSFRFADAIQLAAAEISDCDVFLSNDFQLKQFDGIDCVMVEEI